MNTIVKKVAVSVLGIALLSSAGFGVALGYGGNGSNGHCPTTNPSEGHNNGHHCEGNHGNGNGNGGPIGDNGNGHGNGNVGQIATVDLTSSLGHLTFVGQITGHVQSFLDTVARLLFGR